MTPDLDRVHRHLADAGLALAEAVARLRPDQHTDALRVARLLTEAQQRLTAMTSGDGAGGGRDPALSELPSDGGAG